MEKKEKGGPWEKALEVPGDKLKATVPLLNEGKEYEFRVVPINKAGPGEPSDPSQSIIAKPRHCKFVKLTFFLSLMIFCFMVIKIFPLSYIE